MIVDYEQLSAYLDNELSAAERAALEARLQADAELEAELESLRQTVDLLKQMPMRSAPRNYTLDPALFSQRPGVLNFPRWKVLVPALAAVLVVMIAGVLFLGENGASQDTASQPQVGVLQRDEQTDTNAEPTQEIAFAATMLPTAPSATQTSVAIAETGYLEAFTATPAPTLAPVLGAAGEEAQSNDILSEPSGGGGALPGEQEQTAQTEVDNEGMFLVQTPQPAPASVAQPQPSDQASGQAIDSTLSDTDGASAAELPTSANGAPLPPAAQGNRPDTFQEAASAERSTASSLIPLIGQVVQIIVEALRVFP